MELVDRVLPPKPSVEEIKAGKPVREAYRNDLLAKQEVLLKLKNDVTIPLKISQDNLNKELAKSLAWINVNIEVSVNDINIKQTSFNETFQTLVNAYNSDASKAFEKNPAQEIVNRYPFPEGRKALQGIMNDTLQKEKREKRLKKEAEQNKSSLDIGLEALGDALKWTLLVFIVIYGLRAASFAANQNLYLPLPYRLLKFIYTFIFFPIWIPYYLYREIKHAIWPCIDEPHFESVFPVNPYNPKEGLDFNKRVFGYPDVPDLCDWISKKREEWKEQQVEKAKGNLWETLLAEKADANAKTAA
jgi:hypothetical protein